MRPLFKTKTFWTGAAAVLAAIGSYATGEATVAQAGQMALTGLVAIFLRSGLIKGGLAGFIPGNVVELMAGELQSPVTHNVTINTNGETDPAKLAQAVRQALDDQAARGGVSDQASVVVKGVTGLILAVMLLGASGCMGRPPGFSPDNTITTTTTYPDGRTEKKVEEVSDATTYINGQVKAKEQQKPLWEMKAQAGQKITLDGVESIRVYANTGTDIKAYVSAWERIFVNGLPLAAMVAQGFINADMAVRIVDSVGALAGNKVYNIATQDGSPVNIAGGHITNGTVTIQQNPATTTTTTTNPTPE